MLSNINNRAFKKSTVSVGGVSLVHDHYNNETRLVIPTLGVEGTKGFGFNLIYNENYLMPVDSDFGTNVRFALYRKFEELGNGNWKVTGSDEYVETFVNSNQTIVIDGTTFNIYLAQTQPLKLYVSINKLEFRIIDGSESYYVYTRVNISSQIGVYPSRIFDKNWNSIDYQKLSNGFRYFNNRLDFVEFIKDTGSSYVTKVNVYHENNKTAVTKLIYSGSMLSKVQMYYVCGSVETLVEEYELEDGMYYEYGRVTETVTNETLMYFVNSDGIEVRSGIGLTYSNKDRYPVMYLEKEMTYSLANPSYKVNHYYVNKDNCKCHLYDADSIGNVTLSETTKSGYTTFSHQVSYDKSLSGNDNLLINGDFSNGTTGWTTQKGQVTISNSTSTLDPIHLVCTKKALICVDSQISQTINTTILPNEGVRLSYFYKDDVGVDGEKVGEVNVFYTLDDGTRQVKSENIIKGEMDKDSFDRGTFGFKCIELISNKKITKIEIQLRSLSNASFYVKGLFLAKGDIGNTYTYDDQNRITGVKSLTEAKIYNDELGNVLASFSNNKDYVEYKYGEYNVLLETKDSLGNLTINTYDTWYHDNVIKTLTYFDDKFVQTEKTYNNMGKDVHTETGVNKLVTTYVTNNKTRLLDSCVDPLGINHSYSYDSKKLSTLNTISKDGNSSSVTLTHYPDSSVKEYINGNLKYLFTYNNEGKLKKVEKIDLTDNEVEQLAFVYYDYELDSTKLISNNIAKMIDRSNFVTLFEYDLFGNVTKITRGTKVYIYEYDALQRIKRTYETDSLNSVINPITYTYNIRSQIVQENQTDFVVEYNYDEEGKLKERIFGESTKKRVERFNHLQSNKKNLYHNKKALYEYNGYGCFFEKNKKDNTIDEHMINSKGERLLVDRRGSLVDNGNYGYLTCSPSLTNVYEGFMLDSTSPKVSLALTFKVLNGQTGGLFTLYFRNGVSLYGEIEYIEDDDVTWLMIYGRNNSSSTLLYQMGFESKYDKWTSLALSYDKTTNKVNFTLDDFIYGEEVFVCSSLINEEASLFLGCLHLNGYIAGAINCQIAKVMLTKDIIPTDYMVKMSNESNYILNEESLELNDENGANSASSIVLRDDIYPLTYPLDKTLENRNRQTLKIYKQNDGLDLFEYNPALKDYSFCAKGNTLLKEFSDTTCLTAVANVYFDTTTYNQAMRQIFEVVDGNNRVNFFRKPNKHLCIQYKGYETETNLVLENKTWATVSLCIEEVLTSDSLDVAYYNFRVSLNENSYSTQISTGTDYYYTFSKFNVYIGGGHLDKTHVMNGNISDLYLTNAYLTMTEIISFMNNKETIVYHEYDSLGNIIEEGVRTRNRTITKKSYKYEMEGKRCLGKISKVIQDGVETEVIMNELNNITTLGNTTYTYDYLNRLEKASGNGVTIEYEYDEFGNLLSKTKNGSVTMFTYDKDKLLSYGGTTLEYDDYNRMIGCNNLVFTWEGKQLKSATVSGVDTYTYEYNQNGLRTKKTKGTHVTNYSYEGDLLVKQDDGINTVFYLYDENRMLYGLIHNESKYFYKRNIIGEITDIVDFNGNVVVKYSYDPFGKVEQITGSMSSTLGVINSMLYKGYCYDVETNLFLVSSRYYSPELCRWISPDSIEFLDPQSINGLNLYAYCGNDPVNKYDPSGHFAISTLVLIIVGTAVLTTAGAITYGALTDTPVVLDLSASLNTGAGVGYKVGISIVFDFKNDNIEFYGHQGITYGVKANTFGFSYSPGIILNYENPGDYGGPFKNFGGGKFWGIDHCYDPRKNHSDAVQAYSITFGNNKGVYFGEDEYYYWGKTGVPEWMR